MILFTGNVWAGDSGVTRPAAGVTILEKGVAVTDGDTVGDTVMEDIVSSAGENVLCASVTAGVTGCDSVSSGLGDIVVAGGVALLCANITAAGFELPNLSRHFPPRVFIIGTAIFCDGDTIAAGSDLVSDAGDSVSTLGEDDSGRERTGSGMGDGDAAVRGIGDFLLAEIFSAVDNMRIMRMTKNTANHYK